MGSFCTHNNTNSASQDQHEIGLAYLDNNDDLRGWTTIEARGHM